MLKCPGSSKYTIDKSCNGSINFMLEVHWKKPGGILNARIFWDKDTRGSIAMFIGECCFLA